MILDHGQYVSASTLENHSSIPLGTYTVVATTENTHLGTPRTHLAGIITGNPIPKLYIVGAIFAVTLRLNRTVRNFPNPPAGLRTALRRAPGEDSEEL